MQPTTVRKYKDFGSAMQKDTDSDPHQSSSNTLPQSNWHCKIDELQHWFASQPARKWNPPWEVGDTRGPNASNFSSLAGKRELPLGIMRIAELDVRMRAGSR